MKLSDLGIKENQISEAIVTTYNEDGSPNAAPIGISSIGEDIVVMRIHTTSDTYNNLMRNKACVINVTSDPYLFLSTTLLGRGKGATELEIERESVDKAKKVNAPILKKSSAYIETELLAHKEYLKSDKFRPTKFSLIKCKVVDMSVSGNPIAVNRGLCAAIELAIKLSRREDVDITEYLKIMEKTISRGEYEKILRLLKKVGVKH